MSQSPAEERPGLRVTLLGHAAGHRADGLSSYSEQVATGLGRRGCVVYLHHARADGDLLPVPRARATAWPTFRFKTVTMAGPGFRRRMRPRLAAERPQVTHCSVSFTMADGWVGQLAQELGSATVATFHLPFGAPGSGRAAVMQGLHRFWIRRLRHYQRLIVFRDDHRDQLLGLGLSPGRVAVVPNAVDTETFHPGPSRLRAELPEDIGPVVGYAGRLDPEKGVRALLSGFAAAELGPGARLVVAGSGSLAPEVARASAADPRIVYLGRLVGSERRAEFWRACDIFCLPSSAEGLSISLLEAMASGCAVLATPEGGLDTAGEGALGLVPERLEASLAEQLSRLGADPELARRMGEEGHRRARARHGLEPMITRLLAIYRECTEELGVPSARA